MTAPDLDLLAEYAARLLPPDREAEVSARIAAEPRWRAAHDALVAALPAVQLDLSRVDEGPMPDDIAARLDAALRVEADRDSDKADLTGEPARNAAPAPGSPAPGSTRPARGPAGSRPESSRPEGTRPGGTRPTDDRPSTRRTRRRAPGVALVVVAMFVAVACVGFGIRFTAIGGGSAKSTAGRQANAPAPVFDTSQLHSTASGHDYSRADLNRQVSAAGAPASSFSVKSPATTGNATPDATKGPPRASGVGGDVTGPLTRLQAAPALAACLADVESLHIGQPNSVDYASFEGTPALIIRLTGPTGNPVVVAVGMNCGVNGADQLFAAGD